MLMIRAVLFFTLSAVLSVVTFYQKSEHSLDLGLAVPIGLYFIAALLLTLRPQVSWDAQLQFAGLALAVWLVLFSLSYNLLFFVLAPISGGLGAWLACWLGRRFLNLGWPHLRPIVITGIGAVLLGILFMIAVRELPKETFTIGLKAGVITALWQLGVGVQMARAFYVRQNAQSASIE